MVNIILAQGIYSPYGLSLIREKDPSRLENARSKSLLHFQDFSSAHAVAAPREIVNNVSRGVTFTNFRPEIRSRMFARFVKEFTSVARRLENSGKIACIIGRPCVYPWLVCRRHLTCNLFPQIKCGYLRAFSNVTFEVPSRVRKIHLYTYKRDNSHLFERWNRCCFN